MEHMTQNQTLIEFQLEFQLNFVSNLPINIYIYIYMDRQIDRYIDNSNNKFIVYLNLLLKIYIMTSCMTNVMYVTSLI